MGARFEFFYIESTTLKYLAKYLEEKSSYFEVDIEILHMKEAGYTPDGRVLYTVFCKGKY